MRRMRGLLFGAIAASVGIALTSAGLLKLDREYPPPLEDRPLSGEVLDRDGQVLRAYASTDERWRFPVDLDRVDPVFLDLLVAYEDRRFHEHSGVDPFAVLRAARQLVTNGRIVSGGSTITMQLARLIEPRGDRSLSAKLRQALRALQIERRLSKREILERYLTLAPYGGNLEGIRAASLSWLGKEPERLTLSEAALLVALPQSPEARRPDRDAHAARAARDRVLARAVEQGVIPASEERRAAGADVAARRLPMPALAPHSADAVRAREPTARTHRLTILRGPQEALESVAAEAARGLGPALSVAMVAADARTGEILASVGSADFFDPSRRGAIDMTMVPRSPGSTLKPFIYGLAFEMGMVAQETVVEDRPSSFGSYRPRNFDLGYQGDVSVRTALQMSLNVPAIALLEGVGPHRLASRMRDAGVAARLPPGERPGLAIGLGGVGLSLRDLVQLYTALPGAGRTVAISETPDTHPHRARILEDAAAWQVADILGGIAPPENRVPRGIGYKTGTSYGYRDVWAVGFDGRHVIGVWVGRADGGVVPGISGYATAAPVLFDAFERARLTHAPLPSAPSGAKRMPSADLPAHLARFRTRQDQTREVPEPAPSIVFPPDGARIDLASSGRSLPLAMKLQGGRAPFRWIANGRLIERPSRRRELAWEPEGPGFARLTVVDAAGRSASVRVFIEAESADGLR